MLQIEEDVLQFGPLIPPLAAAVTGRPVRSMDDVGQLVQQVEAVLGRLSDERQVMRRVCAAGGIEWPEAR